MVPWLESLRRMSQGTLLKPKSVQKAGTLEESFLYPCFHSKAHLMHLRCSNGQPRKSIFQHSVPVVLLVLRVLSQ